MLNQYLPCTSLAVSEMARCWLTALLVAVASSDIRAADDALPPRLPGLVATFASDGRDAQVDRRVDLLMHHAWQHPSELDERLGDGAPVDVTWRGALQVSSEGRYQLHLYVAGKVSLHLDGKEVAAGEGTQGVWLASSPIELNFGAHPLELHYHATGPSGTIGLYWQGPGFELEPISERYLTHAATETPPDDYQRGRLLSYALRCAACHEAAEVPTGVPAPDLTRLEGNLERQWLQSWLSSDHARAPVGDDATRDDRVERRMPYFGLGVQDAADITAALWSHSLPAGSASPASSDAPKAVDRGDDAKAAANQAPPARTEPNAVEGRKLFDSRGCLACHTLRARQLGEVDLDNEATYLPHNRLDRLTQTLFDGGDLSAIASKRPAGFFERWLADPAQINTAHRMPTTTLGPLERADVALYLASLKGAADTHSGQPGPTDSPIGSAQRGRELLALHRCGACHKLPAALSQSPNNDIPLSGESRWDAGCLIAPDAPRHVPGFQLTQAQRRALQVYWTAAPRASAESASGAHNGSRLPKVEKTPRDLLLAERNCTACHARGSTPGIAPRTVQLVAAESELAPLLAALQPPSLTGVGDKLHEHALQAALDQSEPPRRPWLEVRMPRYALAAPERERLIAHLIAQDRIPERETHHAPLANDVVTRAAAGRLVTSEGFGCQSCHQIGKQLPPTVALNARGTDLTMLGKRIRRAWFDRWVRNPVRIVPRMEMPAIQMPVHGVLGDELDRQIDSVWEMLNTDGFQPPSPAPVRIVRGHNRRGQSEPAQVLTDVLESPSQVYLRPLIIGLGNRHNLLVDLEKAELGQWWIGDTARELTRGKSWYWEMGGQPLSQKLAALIKFELKDPAGQTWSPKPLEQFAVQFDALSHTAAGIVFRGRIAFAHLSQQRFVPIELAIEPLDAAASDASGIVATVTASLPRDFALTMEFDQLGGELHEGQPSSDDAAQCWQASIDARSHITVRRRLGNLSRTSAHQLQLAADAAGERLQWEVEFETAWPVDEVIDGTAAQTEHPQPITLEVVPGFEAVQLPLPRTEMPTALTWYRSELIAASLKGRVLRARDRNGDGLEETWEPLSDDLPAPYGVAANEEGIDVVAKYGVLRLSEPQKPRSETESATPWPMRMIADGWGYTADYHDWAVGLVPDGNGNYFVALPCQQDDRSPSAARLRGTVQKLVPQAPTSDSPRAFRLETHSAGQRFPMGLAFDRKGELFATDNQGNYNPFNELNHLQAGKRYGFINKLENRPGFAPPFESPAINLPHPWTRSVNGICFLDTPATAGTKNRFGPYEGHLVGCEYNGLSLIRMSLERVDGVYQGAAYLFSRPPTIDEPTFEGPVTCALSPNGALYVGSIHDSGWGGGQNTGSIVRLTPTGRWPLGIGTVRARKDGLSIEFTGPVDPQAAASPTNYSVRSYRRVSTPAYGGSDQDERHEPIMAIQIAGDRTRVDLRLGELRADCVYELRVGSIGDAGQKLFPNEAHYTMKRVPK